MFILIVLIIACYLFLICPRVAKKEKFLTLQHTKFAHRGYHCAQRKIPENSMSAFRHALQRGYGIELDLHLTKDDKLVVFHDDTLERMCGTNGMVEEYTYTEIRNLTLSGTTEHIPLFSDVLNLVKGDTPLLIELKIPGKSMKICEETCKALHSYNGIFLIQSFNTMGLRWFRYNAPDVLRGQLSSNLVCESLKEQYMLRFLVKHLLCNVLGRPDFISYKLNDLPILGVFLCQKIFRIPVAVWTLRTSKELEAGSKWYDFQIFENNFENY